MQFGARACFFLAPGIASAGPLLLVVVTLGAEDAPEPSYNAESEDCGFGSESGAPGFEPLFDHADEDFTIGGESPKRCYPPSVVGVYEAVRSGAIASIGGVLLALGFAFYLGIKKGSRWWILPGFGAVLCAGLLCVLAFVVGLAPAISTL